MRKRILCVALCVMMCLMLAVSAAFAETADTLQKKFVRQLTGGNGIRGKISLTASGVADWLNVLLPFTATEIQVRAIGEKQGEMSASVMDDDDWQIRFYVENSEGQEVGTTWLYGDPNALYLSSELLPDTLLTMPMEQVHLLYQIFNGEYADLFFAFDPMGMTEAGANGNVSAYQAIADLIGIPADEWENNWMPVLEKYLLQLDLWLSGYGDPAVLMGDSGEMTMSATYTIPAEDLKREAKYLIGQMLFDNELMELLIPYVTLEQRITYLNSSMVYFYEACIDALQLEGDIVLSREMSVQGEAVNMSVSLPLPVLPDTLTQPVGALAAAIFELPYDDLLDGMNRIDYTMEGGKTALSLSGEKRTVTLTAEEAVTDEYSSAVTGALRIVPNIGMDENSLSAVYSYCYSHQVWQDDNYLDHDMTTVSFNVEPELSMLAEDDPFRNTYVNFAPVGLEWSVDYRNNAYQEGSAVQVNVTADAKLPDAEIGLDMVLRITTKVEMADLPVTTGENFATLTDERKAELLSQLTANAVNTMANLNAAADQPVDAPVTEETEVPAADPVVEMTEMPAVEPEAEPTEVPPLAE